MTVLACRGYSYLQRQNHKNYFLKEEIFGTKWNIQDKFRQLVCGQSAMPDTVLVYWLGLIQNCTVLIPRQERFWIEMVPWLQEK